MYYGLFSDAADVFDNFRVPARERENVKIILASYDIDGYEGAAFVFFLEKGRFYQVHGSHCSCYGLEDQWEPEEISIAELRHYGENSSSGSFAQLKGEILKTVGRLEHLNLETLSDEQIQMYLMLAMG